MNMVRSMYMCPSCPCLVLVWVRLFLQCFVFPCPPPISPSPLSDGNPPFLHFLVSPPFHSVSSFTVCWALDQDSVSQKLGMCASVCSHGFMCIRYDGVYIQDDGDISLFVCFSLLCASSAILGKMWMYIWARRPGWWSVTHNITAILSSYSHFNNKNIDS